MDGQPVQIFDPVTGQPFSGNVIPPGMISPAAQALLQYIPLPNQPGVQNYRYTASALNDTTNIGVRLIHNFGAPSQGRRGMGFRSRNNVNLNFNYTGTNADVLNPFPALGGKTKSSGGSLNAGYSLTHGKWTNRLSFNFNQMTTHTANDFTDVENVAGLAGIAGVSQSPADFGVPNLTFSNLSSLNGVTPLQRRTRVFQLTDMGFWNRGKHSVRLGGDFRRMLTRLRNNSDPNGTFNFNGCATAQDPSNCNPGSPGATGYEFADFLLGLPLQTAIQYSPYTYNFAAIGYDGFVQDSWRARANLTILAGLRYEYVSPYSEADNRIVNLEFAPGLSAVVPVQPGQAGLDGVASSSLVRPVHDNFAPRIGLAWKPLSKMVVRTGYGINYNLGQYLNMIQELAYQPPFSFTATNNSSKAALLTLANGFPAPAATVTNNYAVDPNYRLGYVQLWNLNIQYELKPTLLLNVGYNGSKGTHLDVVEAPNRGPDGLLNNAVQPFLYETSQADSVFHAGALQLRKRMTRGLSVGGSYIYSKSIDDASSIGGTAVVVAQNPLDLAAQRGLSSFDMRQQFTGNYLYELPLGTGKRWLDSGGALAQVLGNWTWSGDFTIESGTPYTAQYLGGTEEVEQGANGSLRANYNGEAIQLSNPTVLHWFNTDAFTTPPQGTFGDAGRNTIIGPGEVLYDMAMTKTFPMKEMKSFEVRLAASNVFNTPHFTNINTVVASPLFGQVTSVGAMRQLTMLARFRF
jgi:hypothetical protein